MVGMPQKKAGRPKSDVEKVQFSIRVRKDRNDDLEKLAEVWGENQTCQRMSKAVLVNMAIKDFLLKYNKKLKRWAAARSNA